MYITEKYWNNYIGDTDDSLTLLTYLADKQKEKKCTQRKICWKWQKSVKN